VGYSDASQFTREYKRLFGAPPMRDAERLREAAPCKPLRSMCSQVRSGLAARRQSGCSDSTKSLSVY